MTHWIFSYKEEDFRLDECLGDLGFVEWRQTRNVEVGDIVYMYCSTKGKQIITYKMLVEKINIPKSECVDDSKYENPSYVPPKTGFFFRIRPQFRKVVTAALSLRSLRQFCGEKSCMQGGKKIEGEYVQYVDKFFKNN